MGRAVADAAGAGTVGRTGRPDPGNGRRSALFTVMGWVLAILLSLGLNLFLFGIMPGLVQKGQGTPEELEDIRAIQVVRVKRQEPPPKKKERVKPPKPKETPRQVKQVKLTQPRPARVKPRLDFELNPRLPVFENSLVVPPLEQFAMDVNLPKGSYMAHELDAPLTVLAKVPPIYPLRATRLGIQGWVKVRFIVTKEGLVDKPIIVGAKPQGVFEKSVINCVSQWRFKPGTVDGVAVTTQAQTVIKFQLEQ